MTRTRLATTSAATVLLAVGLLTPHAAAGADGKAPRDAAAEQTLELDAEGTGVAVFEQRVSQPRAAARTTAGRGAALPVWDSEPFSQVAVTWLGAAGDVEVRTRSAGEWSVWLEMEPLGDGPDGPETARRQGSDLIWVGEADGVQLRVRGDMPKDLRLVLQRPEIEESTATRAAVRTSDEEPLVTSAAEGEPTATKKYKERKKKNRIPRPGRLHPRRAWNPNNKWLNGKPTYNSDLKQVHIHHTASSNDYSKADVPGIIRGMQRYHTQSLGWFDLGYNFLVDKFGGMWVGRKGGGGKLVRGAHTLGFNHNSTGIAVIGNYQSTKPTKRMLNKIARVASWKLDKHNAPKAKGKVKVTSTGSDRYRSGATVRLPAIDGHRDTNHTACPGEMLYDKLPNIRRKAQRRIDNTRAR